MINVELCVFLWDGMAVGPGGTETSVYTAVPLNLPPASLMQINAPTKMSMPYILQQACLLPSRAKPFCRWSKTMDPEEEGY